MPAIYHEGSWLGNATDPEVLVKDTVGWTGKNLIPFPYRDMNITTREGVTVTANADGSITLNGTYTGASYSSWGIFGNNTETCKRFIAEYGGQDLIVSLESTAEVERGLVGLQCYKLASDSTTPWCNPNQSIKFTLTSTEPSTAGGIYLQFLPAANGHTFNNVTLYPMIRRADITDPTYEPYHESVEVMYEEEIHGVNLLPRFTLADLKAINASGTWNNNVYTRNGITFTVNENTQTVSISSGTATEYTNFRFNINLKELLKRDVSYTMNGMSNSTGRMFIYDRGGNRALSENHGGDSSFVLPSSATFTNNIELIFDVNQNVTIQATTIRPMIRLATIDDPTYRPYNPQAIQNQLNAQGVLGAKNLLPNNATSQTINGVTFTVNADGSVTVNGTATANINFGLISYANIDELSLWTGKHLRLSGCPSGGSNSTYALEIYYRDGREHWMRDFGDGVELNIPVSGLTYINPNIALKNGVTVNNLVFKPMLRLASDPDDTYQPYAMTNRELTEKVVGEKHTTTITTGTTGNWASTHTISTIRRIEAYAKGYIVIPFVNAAGTWFLKVLSTEMQPVASQSIEVTYWTFAV